MSELIHEFGVDWRLLLAQAINFFVLLYVLKRFAYVPILNMLRKRKGEIEKGIRLRDVAEENLKRIDTLKEETLDQAKTDALAIVSQGVLLAREKKDEILAETAKKSEGIILEAKRMIREEKAKMTEEFVGDAEEIVRLGIARVLGKMPAEKRDQELIHEAMQALKSAK
ncbi:MAG: F-type H+-transporting ATPase subunit b [Parcubacteria group bacterium Gr01-1014_33]|nr:MAG: F-type H+-transporting ATPase subunit b [Parcubacteria group bacterium Gr01-1014_33]